jgi:hypothetical protein
MFLMVLGVLMLAKQVCDCLSHTPSLLVFFGQSLVLFPQASLELNLLISASPVTEITDVYHQIHSFFLNPAIFNFIYIFFCGGRGTESNLGMSECLPHYYGKK